MWIAIIVLAWLLAGAILVVVHRYKVTWPEVIFPVLVGPIALVVSLFVIQGKDDYL